MLIVPLGMEGGAVFRFPLVSVVIGAVCLAAFFASIPMRVEAERIDKELEPVLAFWVDRPYLALPVEIEKQFVSKAMRQEALRYFDELDEHTNRVSKFIEAATYYRNLFLRHVPPPAGAKLQREQAELNEMVSDVLPLIEQQRLNAWGLVPSQGLHQAGWLTYVFLHANWPHLLISLFLFALVAPLLEDVWGRILFLYFAIGGSAAAAVAHCLAEPNSLYPLIGATGLIAACLGAFSVRFADEKVQFLVFPALPWFSLVRVVRMPAWCWGVLFFGLLLGTFAFLGDSSGFSYMAHVGGFCAGGVIALALQATGFEQRFVAPSVEKMHDGWTEHKGLAAAQGAMSRGEWGEVQRQLNTVVRDQPDNFEARAGLARLAIEHKNSAEVTKNVDRMLAASLADKSEEAVYAVIKEFWPHLELSLLRPAVAFRTARVIKDEEPTKSEALYRAVGQCEGAIGARAQLELANMYLQLKDHHRALPVLEELLGRADANPETVALAQKRMRYVQEMVGPQLAHEGEAGIEIEDIPLEDPSMPVSAAPHQMRERRLSHAPGVVEFDLDEEPEPEPEPERLVVTCTFAGRSQDGFIAQNTKGKARAVSATEIAEVKVGVVAECETRGGTQHDALVIDLLLKTPRPTGEKVVFRFVGPRHGLQHLYEPGADPAAALHALLTELASHGARVAPGNEVLAQRYPRFNDLGEFDAVRG